MNGSASPLGVVDRQLYRLSKLEAGPFKPVAPGLPRPHEEVTSKVRRMHASAGWRGLNATRFENTPATTPATFPYETVTSAQQQFTYMPARRRHEAPLAPGQEAAREAWHGFRIGVEHQI
jgi:hypothetical protein